MYMSVGWYMCAACAKLEIQRKRNENKIRQGKAKNVCEKFQRNYARIKSEAGKKLNQILFSTKMSLCAGVCVCECGYIYRCDVDCVLLLLCVRTYMCVCKLRFCVCSSSCIFGRGQVGGYSRAVIVVSRKGITIDTSARKSFTFCDVFI